MAASSIPLLPSPQIQKEKKAGKKITNKETSAKYATTFTNYNNFMHILSWIIYIMHPYFWTNKTYCCLLPSVHKDFHN